MAKSNTPIEGDMLMIKIQAIEWVQGQISDIANKEKKTERKIDS
jgi:hypothetical protein